MEDWILAVIIVPAVCFAIIAVIIGCCCMKYYKRKRSSVGGTNNCYVNHGIQNDVESQRKESSNVQTETGTVDENLSVATIINEEKVQHDSGIGRISRKGVLMDITNNNEERVLHNFGTEIEIGEENPSQAIHINKERVHHIFEPGIQIHKDHFSSIKSITELTTSINESKTNINKSTSVNEQRAAQRLGIADRGLGITSVREWVEPSIDREQKLPSKLNSTNIQIQELAKSIQRPASTLDTRSVVQFLNAPKGNLNTSTGHQTSTVNTSTGHQTSTFNTSTGHQTSTLNTSTGHQTSTFSTSTGHQTSTLNISTGHQKSTFNTSTGHQKNNFNISTAYPKNNFNKSIGYPTSNFNTPTGYPTRNFDTLTGYPKLDLHYYRLKDAMAEFKAFLQTSIEDYRHSNYSRNRRFILVVTGRGLHSRGGIPVIKPNVENYLRMHDYTFNWSNPGMVRIDLLSFRDLGNSDSDSDYD